MDEHDVASVTEQVTQGGVELWVVKFRRSDGTEREHFMPKDIFDIRAAEYGIDPTDIDTLMDVVLAEPFIPDPTHPANHADDAAAKAGHTVKARKGRDRAQAGADVPAWLFNAASVDAARTAHLLRVQHVRATRVKIRKPSPGARAGSDPLDVIRAAHRPDTALIAQITNQVDRERRRLRGERVPGNDREKGAPQ